MEGGSKPETVPPGLGRTWAMSGPLLSDALEKLSGQRDSFLTAARLVRGGWTEEGKETGWQTKGPKRVELCLRDPRSRRAPVVNSRRTTEDSETGAENKADVAKQAPEGGFSTNRPAERQTGLWAAGCRSTCRQSRRFKAPILPVIAEM